MTATLRQRNLEYQQVLLVNSIGYQLSATDPCVLPLSELAARAKENANTGALATTIDLHAALVAALPNATLCVFNRAKDPATKRYKYPQLENGFSEALASGLGLSACSSVGPSAEQEQDAIVDWGGGSYKVYVDGKRRFTEVMDANALMCEGDVLNRESHLEAIQEIKLFVLWHLPAARNIFIAQTGKARELALRDNLNSVA